MGKIFRSSEFQKQQFGIFVTNFSVSVFQLPGPRDLVIDFCEWHMEGDEALLLIGSLNYDFGPSEQKLKKRLQKQALATGIWMFRDPDLSMVLSTFWGHF